MDYLKGFYKAKKTGMAGPAFAFEFTGSLLSVEGDLGWSFILQGGFEIIEIKLLIEMRADTLPLGQRRKFIGRKKSKAGSYFYPICGSLDENVYQLIHEWEELSDWRLEVFGRGIMILSGWWVCADDCIKCIRSLAMNHRSLRLAMNHRSRFL